MYDRGRDSLTFSAHQVSNVNSHREIDSKKALQFTDNRQAFRGLQTRIAFAHNNHQTNQVHQPKESDKKSNLASPTIQRKSNSTGLPEQLKAGIENLSGYAMDDVSVHYNSSKPSQLNAHAFAQGTEIHLASGQEKHLPHEAWHVVQQKQGRVKATCQMKDKIDINDDIGLEKEADLMGAKALRVNDNQNSLSVGNTPNNVQLKQQTQAPIQLFDWANSTALTTISDFFRNRTWESAKDLVDPRRARLNPLNVVEGFRNASEENAGGNYHSSSKHGAHNTVYNAMNRLQEPSAMVNKYTGGLVNNANSQGRFNSEAWESFSWRKAKQLFESNIGVAVNWVAGGFPALTRSACNFCLNHGNSDVGISQAGVHGALNSVSGVHVAINYATNGAGGVDAYCGQMYPRAVVAPALGHVRVNLGHPQCPLNGTIQPIPYQFLGYFGI